MYTHIINDYARIRKHVCMQACVLYYIMVHGKNKAEQKKIRLKQKYTCTYMYFSFKRQ